MKFHISPMSARRQERAPVRRRGPAPWRAAAAGLMAAGWVGAQAGVVDVTQFGAVGDGKTDDTAAVQAALDAAVPAGAVVFFPPGRYRITSDLELQGGLHLAGSDHRASVITSEGERARLRVLHSGTVLRDLGFEHMVEPVALVSRAEYTLENIRIERCRFETIAIQERNRGTIGLSGGGTGQRPHRIRYLLVRDCIFQDIDARAIAIRANISEVRILNNQFLDIVNPRGDGDPGPRGGSAISLGESSDDAGMLEEFSQQGRHRIEGNVIRNLRKHTRTGNLIGILLYGNYNTIRDNLIEEIDGTAAGDDTNAMYIRGAHNRILGNTIRNIRGSDDDGALCFKGGLDQGNQHSIIAHNTLQHIYGMSAMEISSSHVQVHNNVILDAPVRGFYHRTGENLWLQDNTFVEATAVLRTARRQNRGEVFVSGNRFIDSALVLSQFRRDIANRRDAVYIHENLFQRTRPAGSQRMIRLANGVVEPYVSIRNNRFHNLGGVSEDDPNSAVGRLVDLATGGTVLEADIIGNHVLQDGPQGALFHIGAAAGHGRFADNTIRIRALRGAVLSGGFSVVENNSVHVDAGADAGTVIPALFEWRGHDAGARMVFRSNRIINDSSHAQIGAVTWWRVPFGPAGQPVIRDNVFSGAFEALGVFTGAVPDPLQAEGNRIPEDQTEPWETRPNNRPPGDAFEGAGRGTAEEPFLVRTLQQLQAMRYAPQAHYALENDIDAKETRTWNEGAGFVPIGDEQEPFTGSFDGRGHRIRNLFIHRPDAAHVGLFGIAASPAVVRRVGLVDVEVQGFFAVGALVGLQDGGRVSESFSTGRVNGCHDVGGLVGSHPAGRITDAYSLCAVSAHSDVGGLAGFHGGYIEHCFAAGPVEGLTRNAGLAGYAGAWKEEYALLHSYWDHDTSPRTGGGWSRGRSSEALRTLETFTDTSQAVREISHRLRRAPAAASAWAAVKPWDMAPRAAHTTQTWYIVEGQDYPRLGWEKP